MRRDLNFAALMHKRFDAHEKLTARVFRKAYNYVTYARESSHMGHWNRAHAARFAWLESLRLPSRWAKRLHPGQEQFRTIDMGLSFFVKNA